MHDEEREECSGPVIGRNMRELIQAEGMGRWHEVRIKKVRNGYIVRVGCETFVFNDFGLVCINLTEYYKNPEAAYDKWISST